jgi:hypothetical protein
MTLTVASLFFDLAVEQDVATKCTFGFTLPPGGSFSEDFIAQVTTPLPYGFVGFGMGTGAGLPL